MHRTAILTKVSPFLLLVINAGYLLSCAAADELLSEKSKQFMAHIESDMNARQLQQVLELHAIASKNFPELVLGKKPPTIILKRSVVSMVEQKLGGKLGNEMKDLGGAGYRAFLSPCIDFVLKPCADVTVTLTRELDRMRVEGYNFRKAEVVQSLDEDAHKLLSQLSICDHVIDQTDICYQSQRFYANGGTGTGNLYGKLISAAFPNLAS